MSLYRNVSGIGLALQDLSTSDTDITDTPTPIIIDRTQYVYDPLQVDGSVLTTYDSQLVPTITTPITRLPPTTLIPIQSNTSIIPAPIAPTKDTQSILLLAAIYVTMIYGEEIFNGYKEAALLGGLGALYYHYKKNNL
jgi:hypothetical protein